VTRRSQRFRLDFRFVSSGNSRSRVPAKIEGWPSGIMGLLAPMMKQMAQHTLQPA
jgi:hypothetical protein